MLGPAYRPGDALQSLVKRLTQSEMRWPEVSEKEALHGMVDRILVAL